MSEKEIQKELLQFFSLHTPECKFWELTNHMKRTYIKEHTILFIAYIIGGTKLKDYIWYKYIQ